MFRRRILEYLTPVLLLCLAGLTSCQESSKEILSDPVIKYNDKDFRIKVPLKHHFVLFFTSWSTESKEIFPIWDELGDKIRKRKITEESPEVIIAKVDCGVERQICEWQDIAEYPTVKLYRNSGDQIPGQEHLGMRVFKYSGVKDLFSLEQFLNSRVSRGAEFVYGARVETIPEPNMGMHILQEENFDDATQEAKSSIVNYCTDWSSRCKRLQPIWEALAKEFRFEDGFLIGSVDCTKQRSLCRVNGVRSFPEIHWYKNHGDYDETFPNRDMEPNLNNLRKWVLGKLGKEKPVEKGINELFGPDDLESMETAAVRLDKNTFGKGVSGDNPVLTYFHTPWCSKCPEIEAIFEDVAEAFNKRSKPRDEDDEPEVPNPNNLVIARVDCALNKDLCDELQIDDMPMFNVYKRGERVEVYKGDLTSDALHDYAYGLAGTDSATSDWGTQEDKNEL